MFRSGAAARLWRAEVALARRDSPNRGGRHLGFARALVHEMPRTLAALAAGALSEWRATLIVRESACLSVADRPRWTPDVRRPVGVGGQGRQKDRGRRQGDRLRTRPARRRRQGSSRGIRTHRHLPPAPDNMVYVTALLPMPQGVAVYASLRREADTTWDGRSRGPVMADTLYERRPGGRPRSRNRLRWIWWCRMRRCWLVITSPAVVPGYGPIPASVALRLAGEAVGDERRGHPAAAYRHPASGRWWRWNHSLDFSPRVWLVHRAARSNVSHAVLRCPDPAP